MLKYLLFLITILIGRFETAFSLPEKLKIAVDEKTELLTVIQSLTDYPVLTKYETSYKKEVSKTFEVYKNHKAVQLFGIIWRQYFNFSKTVDFLSNYSALPGLKMTGDLTKNTALNKMYEAHKDTLDLFITAMRDFYTISKFKIFFNRHKSFYGVQIEKIKQQIGNRDFINAMETFYGYRHNSYTLVICPLLHNGGYGTRVYSKDGTDTYAYVGPSGLDNDYPVYNPEYIIKELILHEFSHSFCNPVIDRQYTRLEKFSYLSDTIKTKMSKHGYATWKTVLYEHLVRACVVRLIEKIFDKETAKKNDEEQISDGFIYLPHFLKMLDEFERDRNKYKQLDDAVEILIDTLGNIKT